MNCFSSELSVTGMTGDTGHLKNEVSCSPAWIAVGGAGFGVDKVSSPSVSVIRELAGGGHWWVAYLGTPANYIHPPAL